MPVNWREVTYILGLIFDVSRAEQLWGQQTVCPTIYYEVILAILVAIINYSKAHTISDSVRWCAWR